MRILWLSHFLPYPPKGGALQRSYHLLNQAAARHDVDLVALSQGAILPTPAARDDALRALRAIARSVTWFPIPSDASRWRWGALVAITSLRRDPYDVTWLESQPMMRHLQRLADTERYDLIHVDTIGLWPYVQPFGDTPVALTHHNVESRMMARRAGQEFRWARRTYFRREAGKLERLERQACRAARTNLVVSPLDADRLRSVAPGCSVHVVENGVDVDYFRPAPGAERPGSLVFVGGMNWYPNRDAVLHFMTEIWPIVLRADPGRSVTFIGQHPPDDIARLADDRVTVTGFVDDIRPHVDAAEIYICPMRDGGGTRLKILDALAMEKPLVASGLAVEGIAVVDGEHYLEADTPADFARAIDRLAADPELRRRLGRNGRALVERKYAWSVVGRSLEAAYSHALEAGDPAVLP